MSNSHRRAIANLLPRQTQLAENPPGPLPVYSDRSHELEFKNQTKLKILLSSKLTSVTPSKIATKPTSPFIVSELTW